MAKGKQKWEIEYESLKTKNIDEEIKRLEGEIRGGRASQAQIKDSNSDEYRQGRAEQKSKEKELQKMKMIKTNMPQIERTLKFRDAQKKRLEELNNQKKEVESTKKLSDNGKQLEDELKKLLDKEKEIKDLLKNPKLSDEKRKELEAEQVKNAQKQNDNHMKFSANQLELQEKLNSPLAKKDFDKEIQATRNMISKSNFIAKNLLAGKRMEEISVDLKNWKDRTFTDKTKNTATKKENSNTKPEQKVNTKPEEKTTTKSEDELVEEIGNAVQEQMAKEDEIENGENKPAVVSEFDEKHPRIAKIKNFFKTTYNTVKNKISNLRKKDEKDEDKKGKDKKGEVKKEEKTEKQVEGKLSKEQINERKTEFYKRLAETGNFSNKPTDGKMTEAMKQQDEIVNQISDDEGR